MINAETCCRFEDARSRDEDPSSARRLTGGVRSRTLLRTFVSCNEKEGLCHCSYAGGKTATALLLHAPTKDTAIQYLDEIGNAEDSQLTAISDFMVHFELTPEGKLQFHSFGEVTEGAIFERAYPLLDDLLHSDRLSDPMEPTARDTGLIRATVAKERKRLLGKKRRRVAQTEIGRELPRRWTRQPR